MNKYKAYNAFTIIELLVVIVTIGILATITIISYSGITNRANIAAIQSELSGSSKKLSIYYALNGFFPTSLDGNGCPTAPVVDTINCIRFSGNTSYEYTYKSANTYELSASRGSLYYIINENSSPVAAVYPWVIIGTQHWSKSNLNVGVMINSGSNQIDNGTIEKYCYSNSEINCTSGGAFYQWDEMMQYSSTPDTPPIQGICPIGSHIPSDAEWTTLINYLGPSSAGTQLKAGGASGLELPLSGYRYTNGLFYNIGDYTNLWSSTQLNGSSAYLRYFYSGAATVDRQPYPKTDGFSVRCLKN